LEPHACTCWPAPNSITLRLLEGFELSCTGVRVPLPLGAQRLLAFLGVHGAPLLRTYVAESLWPDGSLRRASANLRSAVWRTRQTNHNIFDVSGGRLSLVSGVRVDVQEAAIMARCLLDRAISDAAGYLRPDTVTALSAGLLCEWYDEWLLLERDRWNQLRLHALEALAERLLAAGEYSQAVQAALAAVWVEPLRESAHRILIRVHAAEGNLSEAVGQYRRYRQLLHRELKTPPTAQMEELMRALTPH
jgi:DNA-binding SARP family transcriptional activator